MVSQNQLRILIIENNYDFRNKMRRSVNYMELEEAIFSPT